MLSLLLAAGCAAAIVIFSDQKNPITKGITSAYGDFKDGASKRLVLDNERPEFLKSEDKSAKTEDSNNNNGDKEISWYKEIFGTIYPMNYKKNTTVFIAREMKFSQLSMKRLLQKETKLTKPVNKRFWLS